jgi:hypothetical protein
MVERFNKDLFKTSYRAIMPNCTEEELEKRASLMEKKYSTMKYGDNVVHLNYFGGLLEEKDILAIEKNLSTNNLELSHFDHSGTVFAAVEDFMLQVSLLLSDKTTQEILIGISTSALWDTIKSTTIFIWKTVKNKKRTIMTAHTTRQRNINFGIKISLDRNTKFEFKIDGDLSEEAALESMDKALEFLKTIERNKTIKAPVFVIYNKDTEKWEVVDVNTEMANLRMKSKSEEEQKEQENNSIS